MYAHTHAASTVLNKKALVQGCYVLEDITCFFISRRKTRHSVYLQCNHSSSPQCQQDSNQGQLSTFTDSCFLATLSRSTASLRTTTASHNAFGSQMSNVCACVLCVSACVCVCTSLSTYLWREGSGSEVKCVARRMVDMEKRKPQSCEYTGIIFHVSRNLNHFVLWLICCIYIQVTNERKIQNESIAQANASIQGSRGHWIIWWQ